MRDRDASQRRALKLLSPFSGSRIESAILTVGAGQSCYNTFSHRLLMERSASTHDQFALNRARQRSTEDARVGDDVR